MSTLALNSWFVLVRRDFILKSFSKLDACRQKTHPQWGVKFDKVRRVLAFQAVCMSKLKNGLTCCRR